jgi:hypothetical protein
MVEGTDPPPSAPVDRDAAAAQAVAQVAAQLDAESLRLREQVARLRAAVLSGRSEAQVAQLRAAVPPEQTEWGQIRGQLDQLLAQLRQVEAEIAATAARLQTAAADHKS